MLNSFTYSWPWCVLENPECCTETVNVHTHTVISLQSISSEFGTTSVVYFKHPLLSNYPGNVQCLCLSVCKGATITVFLP